MDIERYRAAEARLWEHAGVTPHERRVHLHRHDIEVRILEAGDGPPALFIHGGPNAGSTWAEIVGLLPDFRCLVLDRPGTGLSDPLPIPVTSSSAPVFADNLVADVLDALEIDRAHLVVSSFGGYIALRSAAAHPDRVGHTVQMSCPGFIPGMTTPRMMRLLLFPGIARLVAALPPSEREGRSSLRQIGHGASLDADRIPQVFFDWYLALQRDTPTMRNELRTIADLGSIKGFDPALTLDHALLSSVRSPTYFLWGEDDTFGGSDVARSLVDIMPEAQLELQPGFGHLPWLDDPGHAATVVRDHLTGSDHASARENGRLVSAFTQAS